MLRLSILLAAVFGSLVNLSSAVSVPTTYCDSSKDFVNAPVTIDANIWPPTLGSTLNLALNGDLDSVLMHHSFKNQLKFPVINSNVDLSIDVPRDAHTGTYSFEIHGFKGAKEVYCVEAKWQLASSPEDRGTAEMWADVAQRLKELELKRADLIKEAEAAELAEEAAGHDARSVRQGASARRTRHSIPHFTPEFDPIEAHANMMKTHDQVHSTYPHMMERQKRPAEGHAQAAPADEAAAPAGAHGAKQA